MRNGSKRSVSCGAAQKNLERKTNKQKKQQEKRNLLLLIIDRDRILGAPMRVLTPIA